MGVPQEPGRAPPEGDSPAWQRRKAPLLFRVQLAHPRVLSPSPGGHGLNLLGGSSLPTLPPPHLTCTSRWDGLGGGAPETRVGGVEFQEWAMEAGQKWQTVSIQPSWPELWQAQAATPFIYLPLRPRFPRDRWGQGAESL